MPGNDRIEPASAAKSDWKSAWEAVSRLAAIQQPQSSAGVAAKSIAALDDKELANAVAEIEQASARLRLSEPALGPGIPAPPARIKQRQHWSVWMLIGAIWISATLAIASATSAILYLLG